MTPDQEKEVKLLVLNITVVYTDEQSSRRAVRTPARHRSRNAAGVAGTLEVKE